MVGIKENGNHHIFKIEYDDSPYGQALTKIQNLINNASVLVGFNLKFDLHWLRRYGITVPEHVRVWDVQLAYFAMKGQTVPYPSLNQACEEYGLGAKLDVVATEYWNKGIDTPNVPLDVLEPYLKQDLDLTEASFHKQQELLKPSPKLYTCIRMMCLDMLVLQEMEFNGIILDTEECNRQSRLAVEQINAIDEKLRSLVHFDRINWNSIYNVSTVLYGGTIRYFDKEPVTVTLKNGTESTRVKNVEKLQTFNRLVEPVKNSKLAKPGYWSVSNDTLRELKPKGIAKQIIELLLQRHDLAKVNGTYYQGLPALIATMEWENNTIHGNLNQCVAVTGRLSSSKPNLQNNPPSVDQLFRSRYD